MTKARPDEQWSGDLWEQMAEWLEDAYPREGCGLVVQDEAGTRRFRRCENVIDRYHELDPEQYPRTSADFYMIDPREFMVVEEADEEVAVVVHSHPDADDYFSDADVDAALMPRDGSDDPVEPLYPGVDYLVVSVRQGRASAASLYRFQDDRREFVRAWRLDAAAVANRLNRTEAGAQTTG